MILATHPTRMLEALKAAGRSYRVAVSSSSVMVIQAAVIAGLGISAFTGFVIPDGLIRLDEGLPELGMLEYVIDRQSAVSQAAEALELMLIDAAKEL